MFYAVMLAAVPRLFPVSHVSEMLEPWSDFKISRQQKASYINHYIRSIFECVKGHWISSTCPCQSLAEGMGIRVPICTACMTSRKRTHSADNGSKCYMRLPAAPHLLHRSNQQITALQRVVPPKQINQPTVLKQPCMQTAGGIHIT